jgi:quinate/shikimate dehydrogenase (NAD+)
LGVAELAVFDSDRAKAEQIATQLHGRQQVRIAANVEDAVQGAVGLVNGTPIGMLPDRGTPVPEVLLHRGLWVADAVYSPLWTPLLTAARAKGAVIMTGRELAVHQAADAFELFTGFAPPIVEMGNAFDAVMAKRYAAASNA